MVTVAQPADTALFGGAGPQRRFPRHIVRAAALTLPRAGGSRWVLGCTPWQSSSRALWVLGCTPSQRALSHALCPRVHALAKRIEGGGLGACAVRYSNTLLFCIQARLLASIYEIPNASLYSIHQLGLGLARSASGFVHGSPAVPRPGGRPTKADIIHDEMRALLVSYTR